jgi:hypothetical protein
MKSLHRPRFALGPGSMASQGAFGLHPGSFHQWPIENRRSKIENFRLLLLSLRQIQSYVGNIVAAPYHSEIQGGSCFREIAEQDT